MSNANAASGCSIDDSVRTLKKLGEELNIDFFDRTLVAFKNQEEVITIPISDLKKKFEEGVWNSRQLVFNNLVSTKGELSQGWLVPAGSTWLKRYLPQRDISRLARYFCSFINHFIDVYEVKNFIVCRAYFSDIMRH